jgi:hypothetical protein
MTKKMSPISFFSLYIELRLEEKKIGKATGFLYQPKERDDIYLVTNYHVLTASDPKSPSMILEGYPDCPDEICITFFNKDKYVPYKIKYPLKKENEPIMMIEHKNRDKGIDIVAIPIELPEEAIVVTQNQLSLVDDINFEIGSDLFIVGFPYGFGAGDFLPIWKRGTVASEPLFKPEGLSRFYVDAFTKPGMSGSPVFAFENRNIFYLDSEAATQFEKYEHDEISALELINKMSFDKMANATQKKFLQLVGIYSGRILVHDEKDPNVGIVWQKQLIDELFSEPNITKHPAI